MSGRPGFVPAMVITSTFVVVFGLVNGLSAFQGNIINMLLVLLNQLCIAYVDNIVVYSTLLEEHKGHVRLVLANLQEAG